MFRRKDQALHLAGVHTGRCGEVNSFVLFEEMEEYLSRDIWIDSVTKESPVRKNRKGGRKGADAVEARSDRAKFTAATGQFSSYADAVGSGHKDRAPAKERAMTDEEKAIAFEAKSKAIKALQGVKNQQSALADAKRILAAQPFQAPAKKPLAGESAVSKGKVSFSALGPTTNFFHLPNSGKVGLKLSGLAPGKLTKLSRAKEMIESEPSSESSSPRLSPSSTTPTTPKQPSSPASSSITQTNMAESGFREVMGRQRKKLIQSLTSRLALAGASTCMMDLIKQGSNQCLKDFGKLLSSAPTASPPQGTPTDSTSKPTEACSTKSAAKSKTKSSTGSAKSTSANTNSQSSKKTGKSGLKKD